MFKRWCEPCAEEVRVGLKVRVGRIRMRSVVCTKEAWTVLKRRVVIARKGSGPCSREKWTVR